MQDHSPQFADDSYSIGGLRLGYDLYMVTREQLYAQVWSEPMIKVAARYGVSGTYLARVCDVLNVPRPPRGYWQKLAVGKAAPAETLPEALPGDQTSWDEKGGPLPRQAPPRPVRQSAPGPGRLKGRGKPAEGVHPLIRGALAEFRRSRPVDNGGYLKPYKRLLPYVVASDDQIERALDVANRLYLELEAVGARVMIGTGGHGWYGITLDEREHPKEDRQRAYYGSGVWSPMRPSIAHFPEVGIGVTVMEMSGEVLLRYVDGNYIRETEYQANLRRYRHQHTWTTTRELPIGRFRVTAFSTDGVQWSKTWQEKGSTTIDGMLARIAGEIRRAVPEVQALVEEGRRQAEIRRQEWLAAEERRKQEDDRRRVAESVKQSQEYLGGVITRWADRMAVERFFEELSRSIDELPEDQRSDMLERLQMAREFMGTVDPLDFFRAWKSPKEIYQPVYSGE